jgi:hypothetical protein
MSGEDGKEEARGDAAMPAAEVARLMELLGATGEVHPDLERVLSEPEAERIVEEIFSDEIQDRRA